MVPPQEIWSRIDELNEILTTDCTIIFQNVDRYYFSGTLLGNFILIRDGEPLLFCKKGCARAKRETPLTIKQGGLGELKLMEGCRTIGAEFDVLPTSIYLYLEKIFPSSIFKDVSGAIRKMRSVKSSYEIGRIKKAAKIADSAMEHASQVLCPGMREIDIAASIEKKMREEGHQGLVRSRAFGQELFYGHILSGKSGAVPSFVDSPTGGSGLSTAMPQGAGFKRIRKNEPVLVDYVGVWEGYIADESRTFACGKLSPKLGVALRASLEIQKFMTKALYEGNVPEKIFFEAQRIAEEKGFGKNFLGLSEKIRFVGHGVGLELDELPVLAEGFTEGLRRNMAIASEPKFVFSSGVVGVEDTFFVEEGKGRRITLYPQPIFF